MTPEDDAPESLVGLIDQLVEPPMPAAVSMAPETAGWWIVCALVFAALAWVLWRIWLRWRANAYRRAALADLGRAGDDPAAIATILRRAALAAFPRRRVAGLTGPDWVAFLRETGQFPEDAGAELTRAPYAPGAGAGALRAAAERWIRTHRRAV